MNNKNNWRIIGGFGAHIKSTKDTLIIHHKGIIEEIPIRELSHLLIIGGHNLNTSVISILLNQGIFISFCESDGNPVGYISPYNYLRYNEIQKAQELALPYSYAYTCAKASIDARLLTIEKYAESTRENFLYSGELDIIKGYSYELKNLVKIDELRRIDKLVHDMYYEIISRLFGPSFKFNRRSDRPPDPFNAILSFGYGMLLSACRKALVGGHLNPSSGFLKQGYDSLAKDLISAWKPKMIDNVAINFINDYGLPSGSYKISKERCVLSEKIITELIQRFQRSIDLNLIDNEIQILIKALRNGGTFELILPR